RSVDLEREAFFSRCGETLDQPLAHLVRPPARGLVVITVVDEDHVQIARVIELFAAELSHCDHRKARTGGRPVFDEERCECRAHGSLAERRKLASYFVRRRRAREASRCEPY